MFRAYVKKKPSASKTNRFFLIGTGHNKTSPVDSKYHYFDHETVAVVNLIKHFKVISSWQTVCRRYGLQFIVIFQNEAGTDSPCANMVDLSTVF